MNFLFTLGLLLISCCSRCLVNALEQRNDQNILGNIIENRNKVRKLQESELLYAAQTEIILCLAENVLQPNADANTIESSVRLALGLAESTTVVVSITTSNAVKCKDNELWQAKISIWNEKTASKSASEIASAQIDTVSRNTSEFLMEIASSVSGDLSSDDFTIQTLGYLVVWLDGSGTNPQKKYSDTLTFAGMVIYWPFWLWILFAVVVFGLILPFMIFIFSIIKNEEPVFDTEETRREKIRISLTQIYNGKKVVD